MAAGVYLIERYVVHAGNAHGLIGVGLLILDVLAATIVYLGSLALVSRRSITELMELGKLLLARADRSASTAAG